MAKARVVLKGASSYSVGGVRFLKGVPRVVSGKDVELFKQNAYFHVVVLDEGKKAEKKEAAPVEKAPEPQKAEAPKEEQPSDGKKVALNKD